MTLSKHPVRNRFFMVVCLVGLASLLVMAGCVTPGVSRAASRLPKAAQNLPGVAQIVAPRPPTYMTTLVGLPTPQGVAVSAAGDRIYVAEGRGERRVLILAGDGSQTGSLVPPGSAAGLRKPAAVAVDRRGFVYVVDRLRLAVDIFGPDGRWLGLLEPGSGNVRWEPSGVNTDSQGRIYVTNAAAGAPKVVVFDSSNRPVGRFGNDQEINFPAGVAVAPNGTVYVADSNAGRIVIFSSEGKALSTIGKALGEETLGIPQGVAFDGQGRLYVVDATDHAVKIWDTTASPEKFMFQFGDLGFTDSQFRYPNGIWEDGKGRIFVADRDNDRVQVWGVPGASALSFPAQRIVPMPTGSPVAPRSASTSP